MKPTIHLASILCLCVATALLAGCGSEGPDLGQVSGTVTLGGKNLANARVVFQPVAKGGSPSTATTNAEGYYELMYVADKSGAIVGKHKVTVSTYRQESTGDGTVTTIPEQVPGEYTSANTTPLEKEVTGGSQTIDITL